MGGFSMELRARKWGFIDWSQQNFYEELLFENKYFGRF
jgi:hypothetical protein